MALYLTFASYSPDGVKGLLRDGGTKRMKAVTAMIEKVGGKVHSFHFALGTDDVVLMTEFADRASALAVSLAVNASGAAHVRQVELIDPAEVDAAAKISIAYQAPGA